MTQLRRSHSSQKAHTPQRLRDFLIVQCANATGTPSQTSKNATVERSPTVGVAQGFGLGLPT